MSNQNIVTEFILLGVSSTPELQIFCFMLFLWLYLAAVVGNFLIIVAIAVSNHLPTPVYFLMIFSSLDLSTISVTLPKSLANYLVSITVTYSVCAAQVFFFHVFGIADLASLTIMAYDHYTAICKPIQFKQIMKGTICIYMAASVRFSCIHYSAGNIFHLSFCKSNITDQFFCEVPQLLSCSDSQLSKVWVLTFSFLLVIICLAFVSMSYIQIFIMVWSIPLMEKHCRAFSSCIPHLIMVSMFVSIRSFTCLKPVSNSPSALDLTSSLLYSVLPPMNNPVFCTTRKNDIKAAMSKLAEHRLLCRNKESVLLH